MIEIKHVNGAVIHTADGNTLRGADLRGAYLRGAYLQGADLRWANLRWANLQGAYLQGAYLQGAYLQGADLRGANLQGEIFRGANLQGASLRGADLRGANLRGADLRGADLRGAYLPSGERWEEYLSEVVPALLVAGGRSVETVAAHWDCHTWQNCPMATAFGVTDLSSVPLLLRPRVEQFVQLFDAGLIPKPEVANTAQLADAAE